MLDLLGNPIPGSSDEFADSVLMVAHYTLGFHSDILGYDPPPPDGNGGGGPEYDIYVQDLGQLYGSTFPETFLQGRTFTTYVEIDNDFIFVDPPENRGMPALRVTLAHELHHAIQIGSYAFWANHVYFHEITSTWIEDVVYTEVNDYFQYLFSGSSHFATPETPFTSSDFLMYSRAIWGHFVAKRFGDAMMRRAWELSEQRDISPLAAMDEALSEQPSQDGLREAFSEWSVWNSFTGDLHNSAYYPEGYAYPRISQHLVSFVAPSDSISGSLAPLSSMYHYITSEGTPLLLITSNTNVTAADLSLLDPAPFAYAFSTSAEDSTYDPTLSGIYVQRNVEDPFFWATYSVVNGLATLLGDDLPARALSEPFPNPFSPEGGLVINFPVSSAQVVEADLYIFSSDMDLTYSIATTSRSSFGRQVVQWDGKTSSGETAVTGIYFYVASFQGQVQKGKFALIRR
jgi:hypothetical protein